MAKRRKNRTHLKGAGAAAAAQHENTPKTFIVRHGAAGSSLAQLVRDMRKVMEPNTASRLRERKRNKLKDFMVLAPTLGVSHIMVFTVTPLAPSLRLIKLSAGPTLSFKVEKYSLVKDIVSSSRQVKSVGMEYLSPPLLVLASFPTGPNCPPHLSIVIKSFQSLFPPLSPSTISLSTARRVVLLSYDAENGTIEFRHYLIGVRASGVSRKVRKIMEGGVGANSSKQSRAASVASSTTASRAHGLNLGSERDLADYLLRSRGEDGYETAGSTSAASEVDPEEVSVQLASDYTGRNNRRGEKRAVRLTEIGPRMELRLVKIAEGTPGKEGGILFHEFVKKSAAEAQELKKEAAAREKLRKRRREEQERNVLQKEQANKAKKGSSQNGEDEDSGEEEERDEDQVMDDMEDDLDENTNVSDEDVTSSDGEDGSDSEEDDD